MGYRKQLAPTRVTLPSDENYWVDVAQDMKWGQVKRFVEVSEDGKVNMVAASDAFMLAMIKAWNLDDDQGQILPITQDNIDALDKDDALAIIKAAGGEVEETDDQKKSSTS
jgi:hypothetical protein